MLILVHCARWLPGGRGPQLVVLTASLLFYGWPKPFNLIYLLASVAANFFVARLMGTATEPWRKRLLVFGVLANILFLGCFKYVDFLFSNVAALTQRPFHPFDIAFPLGVSFFTIAQTMYLVDVYEELTAPAGLLDHATFVSFFPYVLSGPISSSGEIREQFPKLNSRAGPSTDIIAQALFLFSIGLIKKVMFANSFSMIADWGFDNITSLSMLEAWLSVVGYGLQLYFDFSGYTDMAMASALLLRIEIPQNFNSPLRATSIVEFWQRWHMTLTAFITTYLYTPMLRAFRGVNVHTAAIATLIAMAVSGLWHGAGWTYVVWGLIHGTAIAINQYWRHAKLLKLPLFVGWLLTAAVVLVGFAFFRASNLSQALAMLGRMVDVRHPTDVSNYMFIQGVGIPEHSLYYLPQVLGLILVVVGRSSDRLAKSFRPSLPTLALTTVNIVAAFVWLTSGVSQPFIYLGF